MGGDGADVFATSCWIAAGFDNIVPECGECGRRGRSFAIFEIGPRVPSVSLDLARRDPDYVPVFLLTLHHSVVGDVHRNGVVVVWYVHIEMLIDKAKAYLTRIDAAKRKSNDDMVKCVYLGVQCRFVAIRRKRSR